MTNQHPATPTSQEIDALFTLHCKEEERLIAAFRAGADQELEACCEWFTNKFGLEVAADIADLRAARRPKPPNLKEQALAEIDALENMGACNSSTIRRALEALDD